MYAYVFMVNVCATVQVFHYCIQVCDFTGDPSRIMTFLGEMKNFTEVEKCDLSTVFNEM